MALVWWCSANGVVLEPWRTANCVRGGKLCEHLLKMDDGELPIPKEYQLKSV
jgi:hypothetical protein